MHEHTFVHADIFSNAGYALAFTAVLLGVRWPSSAKSRWHATSWLAEGLPYLLALILLCVLASFADRERFGWIEPRDGEPERSFRG